MTSAPSDPRSRASHPGALGISVLLALAVAAPAFGAEADGSPSPSPTTQPIPAATAPPPPASSPGASPGSSPVASPASPVRQGTLPAEGGPVEPGTYRDWSLGPTLTFDVPEGWVATPVDAGFGLALIWAGAPAPAVVTFTEFTGSVFQDPCLATTDATLEVGATAAAIVDDIAQSPYLVVGVPQETELAGYPALSLDVATQQPMGCEPPETWLWANPPSGGFVLSDGQQAAFTFVDVGERVLVVSYETFPGVPFEPFAEAAMELIATLRIDPTTDPGPSAPPQATGAPATSPGG